MKSHHKSNITTTPKRRSSTLSHSKSRQKKLSSNVHKRPNIYPASPFSSSSSNSSSITHPHTTLHRSFAGRRDQKKKKEPTKIPLGRRRTVTHEDGTRWFYPVDNGPPIRVNEREYNWDPADLDLPQLLGSWSNLEQPIQTYARSDDVHAEPREAMEFDVLIVGGGPAGLSAAIRLKQLCGEQNKELSVCLIEKGAEIGSHILSGNVFQPTYLNELIPDWKNREDCPVKTKVTQDAFFALTKDKAYPLPIPPTLHNDGNYIISLGELTKFLAKEAENLGVEIYPGFAASEVLYTDKGNVKGIATGDVGIAKDGTKTENFARGVELHAKQTLFSEGARGSCSETLIKRFNLAKPDQNQTYGLGIKEIWELSPEHHNEGNVYHTVGFPSPSDVYSGGFIYHAANNLAYLGLVVGLDYKNPYLSPYQEMQKWKTHPMIAEMLEGAKPVSYGARALTEGGYQAIPELSFPGGMLLGCSAGLMNVPKIKGSHNAMKSGMIAAEGIFKMWQKQEYNIEMLSEMKCTEYLELMEESPILEELYAARNIRPAFRYGMVPFLLNAGLELFITKGKVPWTLAHHNITDDQMTQSASLHRPIDYPKPNNKTTFSLLDNLQRANTMHDENQPSHLKQRYNYIKNIDQISYSTFAAPETRFCPAGVYEFLPDDTKPSKHRLQINAQNCIHCKTCDIKTPNLYIQWTVPQGGEGPNYNAM